jgi:fructose-1,6-bisphosphatase/inositol monophosphatase family enzyme
MPIADHRLLTVLDEAADAIASSLEGVTDRGLVGEGGAHAGQHHSDVVADAAALPVLLGHGLGVLSEESGLSEGDREVLVVLDPLDGSTNYRQGIPWYAASLAAVDGEGALAAVVVNLAIGTRYRAVRDQGAERDGRSIGPSGATTLGDAIVGLSGHAGRSLGWRQYRALGAAALDLCAVADGTLDGYIDCSRNAHGPWDYLGAALVGQEAGAHVVDLLGRPLATRDPAARRTMVAGATPELCQAALEARRSLVP